LNHKDASYYINKGICLYELGRQEEAMEEYDKAIALDQKNANYY